MRVRAEIFEFEAHPQADRFADGLAERRRHAARRRAGGETSRLQQDELAALRPVGVEQRERRARGFAGAGRRDDDKVARRRERRADLRQHVVDRQRRKFMQHRRRALQKVQILQPDALRTSVKGSRRCVAPDRQ